MGRNEIILNNENNNVLLINNLLMCKLKEYLENYRIL